MARKVLVTGGSGYLGSFLVVAFTRAGYDVAYTYLSALPKLGAGTGHKVNLCTGEGLNDCLGAVGEVDAVINCAALSQPAACEQDRAAAYSLNVPAKLVEALLSREARPLLIHISTDQVYAGTKQSSVETDTPMPTNAYGASKLAAEEYIRRVWVNHVILRSSIIYGPATAAPGAAPLARALFLQWLDGALKKGPIDLFEDEWRCPVFVSDIVDVCLRLLEIGSEEGPLAARTFNLGGPDRLSRADMGDVVVKVRGYPAEHVQRVPSASVKRPVVSPADISMDSSRLVAATGAPCTRFEEGVRRALATTASAAL